MTAVENNLLMSTLGAVTDKGAPSGVILNEVTQSIAMKYLPSSVVDFRPSRRQAMIPVSNDQLRDQCQNWIDT